jgi:hypothetical protein
MRFDELGKIFDVSADCGSWDIIRLLCLFDEFNNTSISTGRRGDVCKLYYVSKRLLFEMKDLLAKTSSVGWSCTLHYQSTPV